MRALAAFLVVGLLTLSTVSVIAAEVPHANDAARSGAIEPHTSIFLSHTGSDAAGAAFVASLRDGIRQSSKFRLAESEAEANVILVIVSTSPASTTQVASAISLAYVANNPWRSLLGTAARFVGRDKAAVMGRETVAELTAVVATYDPTVR